MMKDKKTEKEIAKECVDQLNELGYAANIYGYRYRAIVGDDQIQTEAFRQLGVPTDEEVMNNIEINTGLDYIKMDVPERKAELLGQTMRQGFHDIEAAETANVLADLAKDKIEHELEIRDNHPILKGMMQHLLESLGEDNREAFIIKSALGALTEAINVLERQLKEVEDGEA